MSAAAFFEADGDTYQATELTRGPWHKDLQHAGPPSALLARAIEQQAGDMQVVRLSIDLLKAVPITALRVSVQERVGGKRRRMSHGGRHFASTLAKTKRALTEAA